MEEAAAVLNSNSNNALSESVPWPDFADPFRMNLQHINESLFVLLSGKKRNTVEEQVIKQKQVILPHK